MDPTVYKREAVELLTAYRSAQTEEERDDILCQISETDLAVLDELLRMIPEAK